MAGRKWSQEDSDFVKDNFGVLSTKEISEQIGRTKRSVIHQYDNLGLKKDDLLLKEGDKVERLFIKQIVVEHKYGQNYRYAICECDCGNEVKTKLTNLKQKHTQSCGCLRNELAGERTAKRNYKHGEGSLDNRLFRIWCGIKDRCSNPNCVGYKNYGGRGIKICDQWLDYINFRDWALDNGYNDRLSIDRINNDGNYENDNCRWVDSQTQNNNKRTNIPITAFGETKTLAQWVRDPRCKVKNYDTIYYRLSAGYTSEEAFTSTERINGIYIEAFGERKHVSGWLKDDRCYVKNAVTLCCRIGMGYTPQEAMAKHWK